MPKRHVVPLILIVVLCGAGCNITVTKGPPVIEVVKTDVLPVATGWKQVGQGLERRVDVMNATSSVQIILYRFAAGSIDITIAHSTSVGSIATWRSKYPQALAVMNGEYFDEEGMPSGSLMADGQRIGRHAFDADKSGYLIGGPSPTVTDGLQGVPSRATDVLQSYPFFVKDGEMAIPSESGKTARRTFVGMDDQQRLYVGVVSDGAVTLHELAVRLMELDIKWTDVLNLDGGPSTGLSVKAGEWSESINSWTSIPNVVIVTQSSR